MPVQPFLNIIKSINILTFIFLFSGACSVFAAQPGEAGNINRGYIEYKGIPETKKGTVVYSPANYSPLEKKTSAIQEPLPKISRQEIQNLTELQSQARVYRGQGLEFQRIGNIEAAMSLYQKAVQIDPGYAVAYNDLGIIYEMKGFRYRAEDSYLRAIAIDPNYLSAYSNLALLYEKNRDLNKAAFYWKKRADLGSPNDPWTEKAKQRVRDIQIVHRDGYQAIREQEVIDLIDDVNRQKQVILHDDKSLAGTHFEKAKRFFQKEDYATAMKEALDAQQLDPNNKELERFIEKVQSRALSR